MKKIPTTKTRMVVRISPAAYRKLAILAKRKSRKLNAQLNVLIAEAYERYQKKIDNKT